MGSVRSSHVPFSRNRDRESGSPRRGALLARRQVQRPAVHLRPGAHGSGDGRARRGLARGEGRALSREPDDHRRGGRREARERRPDRGLRHRHGGLRRDERDVRRLLRAEPTRADHDRRRRPAGGRRGRDGRDHRAVTVTARDVKAARAAVQTVARRTPILSTRTFSERAGGTVALKAENLQRTGSFKVRGVAAKLAALGHTPNGVVAASAGNHAQAVAAAAATRGIPCEVFVPTNAPMAKVEAAREQGAIVHIGGTSVDACLVAALARAEEGGLAFVHPFDDPAIVAGQGSLGLELLEEVEDLAQVVVPVGGGGLCAGIALVIKDAKPDVKIVGVQAAACAPYLESMQAGTPIEAKTALTIADGIAVKRPGGVPLAILRTHLDDMVLVDEEATANAMALLLERCKLVVEGAGAVGVAAILNGSVAPVDGTTVAVLSGGNVDATLLAAIARRHDTESGRRLVALTRIPDRPGGLATLLAAVANTGANLVDVSHVREGLDLHVRETAVELVLETRGHDHAQRVLKTLYDEGYEAQVLR